MTKNIFRPCASESFPHNGLIQNSKSAARDDRDAIEADTFDMLPPVCMYVCMYVYTILKRIFFVKWRFNPFEI